MSKNIEISFVKSKYPKTYRLFTILPWFIALSIIIFSIIGYVLFYINDTYWVYVHQSVFFFIIWIVLFYYVWWILRGFEYTALVIVSIFQLHKYAKINFQKIFSKKEKLTRNERFFANKLKDDIKPEEIVHWFIVPTYKESKEILDETLQALVDSDYNKEKFAVTIAGEEWDKENFLDIAKSLEKKYSSIFGYFAYSLHPKWVTGEIPGKGANIKYSANLDYEKIVNKFDVTYDKVLVTTLDADTKVDVKYPSILTYSYIKADDRKYKSYQPMILFFNNYWDSPFFSKIVSLWNSMWLFFNAAKKYGTRNFSTHAQPLDALVETEFWSSETIVEDWHQYWRSYFEFDWNYECVPIFTKVYQDANLNDSLFDTAKSQFSQIRRWAHGAEDIAYVFCQYLNNRKNLNFYRTSYEFLRQVEGTILWSTLHTILTIWLIFTIIRDISLSSYITLWNIIGFLNALAFILLIMMIFVQFFVLPWYKLKTKKEKVINFLRFFLIYPIFIGPILLFFTGMPALYTQIAIMLNKPMKKFNVTKKVRV